LVVQYHPDKHGGDVRYEEQFKAVAVAYGVLGDAGKRATYDFQLAQAVRRLDEERRRQQHRPATQHVYGVPMPPPAPLRTRPPAGSRERHYQRIPPQPPRFNGRDWLLTLLFIGGLMLAAIIVKVTMDRVSANSNYANGLRAYAGSNLGAAHSFLEETLHFRPDFAPALRRHGELELLLQHNPRAARTDFLAALQTADLPPHAKSDTYYYLGRAEARLAQPEAAEQSFTKALEFDSTRSAAHLARGEVRLLDLQQAEKAEADFTTGLAQRQRAGQGRLAHYVQLRGLARTALQRYNEARNDYFEVIRANPKDGRTHFLLGKLAAHTGDSTAACEFYRRAVALGYGFAREAEKGCR
jgi:tetratricopeptide (TPR) repeat protein